LGNRHLWTIGVEEMYYLMWPALFRRFARNIVWVLLGNIFLFHGGHYDYRKNNALSLIYIVFLMNISRNPRSKIKLESPLLNKLGRISYGIYMYHMPVIYGVLIAFRYLHFEDNSFIYNVILYTLVTVLTVSIAQLSYSRFEQPFLRMKKRFTIVESGEQAVAANTAPPLQPDSSTVSSA
jgi:peptidoglycan/LPS O-acetylase OafA/YrhL